MKPTTTKNYTSLSLSELTREFAERVPNAPYVFSLDSAYHQLDVAMRQWLRCNPGAPRLYATFKNGAGTYRHLCAIYNDDYRFDVKTENPLRSALIVMLVADDDIGLLKALREVRSD